MTGERRWRLGRRPELDGLRALAVILVVLCHGGLRPFFAAGSVGVTIFFTLSGFLITTLLLVEDEGTGRVDMRRFYAHRFLRLLPALVATVAAAAALELVGGYTLGRIAEHASAALLYVSNWVVVDGGELGLLHHTWSLSIEEQFYVAWPALLLLIGARRRALLMGVAAGGVVYAVVARAVLWDGGAGFDRIYYGADTRADALLVGCLLALVMHQSRDGRAHPCWAVALVGALVALGFTSYDSSAYLLLVSAVPILAAALIWCLVRGDGVAWITHPALVAVGRRSYGLYLWHYVIFFGATRALDVPRMTPLLALPLAVIAWGVTLLSWRYVEQPFLAIKDRDRQTGTATAREISRHVPS